MQNLPTSLKIGVLRGGPSQEYDLSLKSGGHVLDKLSETHRPIDIFISKEGKWHMQGIEKLPEKILKNVDVAFNALHGAFGEDGKVQEILQKNGVPYTGSGRLESAIAINKYLSKEQAISVGIKTPTYGMVSKSDNLKNKSTEIFNSIPGPLVVKPVISGSTLGFYMVKSFSELLAALQNIFVTYDSALVEEYISGKEVSCVVTDDFRGEEIYAFPPSSKMTKQETEEVEETSKKIHKLFGLRGYSKSDFVVSPKRGVYFLEVNTSPKFHPDSVVHRSLESVGVSIKEFLHHLISLAMYKK